MKRLWRLKNILRTDVIFIYTKNNNIVYLNEKEECREWYKSIKRGGIKMSTTCVFCKIIEKTMPSTIVYESENTLVINDINPKAPIHYLILPKKHRENIVSLGESDSNLIWDIIQTTQKLAQTLPQPAAFNLIANNGADAGQSVFHLHFHFLAGKNMYHGTPSL
jgi:histidine triad (HIT) family protein